MINLKSALKTGGSFLAGVVGHHYMSKLLDYRNDLAVSKEAELKEIAAQQNMEALKTKLDALQKTSENILEPLNKLADKHVPDVKLIGIKAKIEIGVDHCKAVTDVLDKGPEKLDLEHYLEIYRAAVACERSNREAHNEITALVESLIGKNNLVSLSDFNLDSFYKYLDSLSLFELSALYHLIILILISTSLFNILTVVLGNEIIKYYKIEERLPKLAFFLKLRLKFQKYYLIVSFSFIFFICIASIILNIIVLY